MVLHKMLSEQALPGSKDLSNSLYIFIFASCLIGFLYGLINWYRVTSIALENGEITPETKQIAPNTLSKLIDYNIKIAKVKYNF